MDVMRSSHEADELGFNMDSYIDQAAEMFIKRFPEQMNTSWKF
jgi:hypothetical protein